MSVTTQVKGATIKFFKDSHLLHSQVGGLFAVQTSKGFVQLSSDDFAKRFPNATYIAANEVPVSKRQPHYEHWKIVPVVPVTGVRASVPVAPPAAKKTVESPEPIHGSGSYIPEDAFEDAPVAPVKKAAPPAKPPAAKAAPVKKAPPAPAPVAKAAPKVVEPPAEEFPDVFEDELPDEVVATEEEELPELDLPEEVSEELPEELPEIEEELPGDEEVVEEHPEVEEAKQATAMTGETPPRKIYLTAEVSIGINPADLALLFSGVSQQTANQSPSNMLSNVSIQAVPVPVQRMSAMATKAAVPLSYSPEDSEKLVTGAKSRVNKLSDQLVAWRKGTEKDGDVVSSLDAFLTNLKLLPETKIAANAELYNHITTDELMQSLLKAKKSILALPSVSERKKMPTSTLDDLIAYVRGLVLTAGKDLARWKKVTEV